MPTALSFLSIRLQRSRPRFLGLLEFRPDTSVSSLMSLTNEPNIPVVKEELLASLDALAFAVSRTSKKLTDQKMTYSW
jgi:hypothetical protein